LAELNHIQIGRSSIEEKILLLGMRDIWGIMEIIYNSQFIMAPIVLQRSSGQSSLNSFLTWIFSLDAKLLSNVV